MAQKNPETQNTDKTRQGLTPLMQQYRDIKSNYPDTILFFRLGDFYEMFGEDAIAASSIMELVLTKRGGVPMCGVPYHAANSYIRKLIKAERKVAICEQLEEASSSAGRPGGGKGLVKRGVVRVITPGTILEDNLLDAKTNNYLASVVSSAKNDMFGLAFVDISTGEFLATEITPDKLKNELFRVSPGEIVAPRTLFGSPYFQSFIKNTSIPITPFDDWHFVDSEASAKLSEIFRVKSLKPLGLENRPLAVAACGGILSYLEKTQNTKTPALSKTRYYSTGDYLLLDETAIRNLEIVEGLSSKNKADSLLDAVDETLTPMGARALRQWLLKPLISYEGIIQRQQAVGFFVEDGIARRNTREALKEVSDIERILSRLSSNSAGPKELAALKASLAKLNEISGFLKSNESTITALESIKQLSASLKTQEEIQSIVSQAINDDPPATLKDGGVIRQGYSNELDELRLIRRDSKNLISEMELNERKRTGINSLKIGYTSVFGYYLEISKSNIHLAPQDYIRKQTVAGGERFITPELKAFEEKLLSAEEKISKLEDSLYKDVCARLLAFSEPVRNSALAAAELDIYASFAETAALRGFVKPVIEKDSELEIKDGRHPVVEEKIKSGDFVANDTYLNGMTDQIMLLTGPNMAGKSTYLRQVALIVILAQAGSFVPCASARVGIVDRIFTRIGAGDNLTGGESTFMVEMHETANILNQHTAKSLLILDEVGRGTSTYDGISIAWAAVEFLARSRQAAGPGPKVLFATHYFELTDLEGKISGIKNYNVSVKEWRGNVVFLHKIIPGAADRSYGIHVAKLAGLPEAVISKAYKILAALEQKPVSDLPLGKTDQLDFFAPVAQWPAEPSKDAPLTASGCSELEGASGPRDPVSALPSSNFLVELEKLEIDSITPLEALQILSRWKKG